MMRTVRHFARFRREEDGSLIVFSLFLIIGMLIIGGFGVDLMYYEAQRTRVQATTDRAVLAAAHPKQTPGSVKARKEVVMSYFTSAGLGDYISEDDIDVDTSMIGSEVSAEARLNVEPILLQLIGGKGFDAVGSATAAQSAKLVEVSLVVDVSGSMLDTSTTGRSKLVELKDAARGFSNLLLCNPDDMTTSTNCTVTDNRTSLSLVPYSSQVTVGPKLLKKFTRTDAQEDSYCATFTNKDFAVAGIDPDVPLRQAAKYYGFGPSYVSNRVWWDPNGWNEPAGEDAKWYDTWWSCYTEDWREITPLEDSPTDMRDRINALDGLGGTAIHVGMKWGVALLQNDMSSVVSSLIDDGEIIEGFRGRPINPALLESKKIVVLMTDGLNSNYMRLKDGYRTGPSPFWRNTRSSVLSIRDVRDPEDPDDDVYHWYNRPSGAPATADHAFGDGKYRRCSYYYGCSWVDEPGDAKRMTYQEFWRKGYTWRIFESYDFLGEPGTYLANKPGKESAGFYPDNDGNGIMNVDQLLLDQCNAAKAQNIKIYTIELETEGGSGGGSILERCATSKAHYFKVDGVDLAATFSLIGKDIRKLHLKN